MIYTSSRLFQRQQNSVLIISDHFFRQTARSTQHLATMWEPHVKFRDPITGTVWAALICTFLTEYTSSTRSELFSELLCWIILPTLFRTVKYNDLKSEISGSYSEKNVTQYKSLGSLWIVALSIAFSCAYKTENRVIQFFVGCLREIICTLD